MIKTKTSKPYPPPPKRNGLFVYSHENEAVVFDPISLESVQLDSHEYSDFMKNEKKGEMTRYLEGIGCSSREIPTRDLALEAITRRLESLSLPTKPRRITGLRIVVTTKCNLNCSYCFVNTNSGAPDLSESELQSGLQFLFQHNEGQDEVTIQWFGGEPTLRFDLIAKGDQYIETLRQDYRVRRVRRTIVTNAVRFTEEMLSHFAKFNYGVGVSIDGSEEMNHRERKLLSGNSYFSQLRANINQLRQFPDIYLGANLTPTVRNVEHIPDIVEYLIDDLNINFIYVNDPIPAKGHEKISGIKLADALSKARMRALSRGAVLHSLLDRVYQALDTRTPRLLEEIDGSMTGALLPGGVVSLSDLFWTDRRLWQPVAGLNPKSVDLSKGTKTLLPVNDCLECPAIAICGGPPLSHAYFSGCETPDPEHCSLFRRAIESAIWDMTGLQ